MKIKYSSILILLCVSFLICPRCGRGDAGRVPLWRFAVISDTQGDRRDGKNKSCINDEVLNRIASDIVRERPDLVLVSGDLVNGWLHNRGTGYESQYAGWKKAMKPVFEAGIMVFAVRGNHDSGPERIVLPPLPPHLEPPPGSLALLEKEFRSAVIRPYTPMNGPEGENGLTYSFVHKNAFIIGLDQFSGRQHRVNQEWLERQLQANKQVHLFVFGHEPAFEADHRDNLSFFREARDRFWESIGKAGARIYFCGHDHFYNRALVGNDGVNPMWQVIGGTGGGRLRTWSGIYKESKRVQCEYHNGDYHGYILVTVDGTEVTVIWKALVNPPADEWRVYDRFTYNL